ncbi:MAG: hypothetical protein ACLQU2_13620 [Candidatus Binataceae bacterium]
MELVERMEELIDGYQPDILLPEQYNELRRRRHELTGELKLMFAVLEDAIHCYLHYMNAKTRQRRILFYEVREWMNSKQRQGLFAYDTLCEALGIDGARLRKMLEQQRGQIAGGRLPARQQRTWMTRMRPRAVRTSA